MNQDYIKYFRALSHKRRAAFFILCIEHLSKHLWRPLFWTILFMGLWMIGIPAFFGKFAVYLTPIVFFGGLVYLIKKDISSYTFPTAGAIDHFLESSSHFPRGTIESIEDELANPTKPLTRSLWTIAHEKVLKTMRHLRLGLPRAFITREDPYALRFIAVLTFLCGLMIAQGDWKPRIINGLFPIDTVKVVSAGRETNTWITTPGYTQMGQIHIQGDGQNAEAIDVPEGSTLRIRTHSTLGSWLPPTLYIDGSKTELDALGSSLYGIDDYLIPRGENINIYQSFMKRLNLDYNYIIDTAPEIFSDESMLDEPIVVTELNANEEENEVSEEHHTPPKKFEILEHKQIRVPLIVKDDYGVVDLTVRMDINSDIDHLPLGKPFEETRLVMSRPDEAFKISPTYDLTWHSWAGLPVTLTFTALDHKEQSAQMEPIELVLPERKFKHPMAQSLIAMRKKLAWNYDDSFMDISRNLETLLSAPDYFQNNLAIFLSIRTASSRLRYSDNLSQAERIESAQSVIKLLWHAAITIEDGNLTMAMRELRDAQRTLENAMRDPNASEDEITHLMDDLREKMANYFTEMQREMQKMAQQGKEFPQISPENFGQMISPDFLSKMMRDIESALRSGDTQKAQELMSQMQRMMEMMDPSMAGQLPSDMQMMQEGINELEQLIEKQKALLEETRDYASRLRNDTWKKDLKPLDIPSIKKMLRDFGMDESRLPAPETPKVKEKPTPPAPADDNELDFAGKKAEQEALRYILGQLMMDAAEKLPEIPETMGLAEQEMRGSEKKLANENPHRSIPHQEKAIEYLEQAQEKLSQQFRQRMQQMVGIGLSAGQRVDPLGRPYGGEEDPDGQSRGSDVKVPDEAQKKRVDEILRELRDRSGDRSRSDEELEYFRRLLRQF